MYISTRSRIFCSFLENVAWFDDFRAKYTSKVIVTLDKQQKKIFFSKKTGFSDISEIDDCLNELSQFLKVNMYYNSTNLLLKQRLETFF